MGFCNFRLLCLRFRPCGLRFHVLGVQEFRHRDLWTRSSFSVDAARLTAKRKLTGLGFSV